MFDFKKLEIEPEFYLKGFQKRGLGEAAEIMSQIEQALAERKRLIAVTEELQASRNRAAEEIAQIKKSGGDFQAAIAKQKEIGPQLKEVEARLKSHEDELSHFLSTLPNIPDGSVPAGKDESNNQEVSRWGEVKDFDFPVKSHDELGEERSWMDFKKAAEMTGARFAVLKSVAARLERALIQFMLDTHTEKNRYEEIIPPFIVNRQTLFGTGNLPKFEEDLFRVEPHSYFLIPTAEAPLTNLHMGEILNAEDLPKYYTAYTPCFRSEAGSYGRDVKGLIRQHQFNKVELVKLCRPEDSESEHEKMLRDAQGILESLELPYRTQLLCAGDMGFSAQKTYDLEVWVPSQNSYREISSVSNCGDFQARRMGTRFKEGKEKPRYVHTLNGSGLAVGRCLIAILENYQTEDGKLKIPQVLRSYMGGLELA